MLAGRAIEEGGKWFAQPIRRAVSNVAEMSEVLWVPDLGWSVRPHAPLCLHSRSSIHYEDRNHSKPFISASNQCKL